MKPRLRDTTNKAWFSCLLGHPARYWSGSILTSYNPSARMQSKQYTLYSAYISASYCDYHLHSSKFTIQHLPSVMVLQSVPHPQLAILVSSLMHISPFPIRFLHLLTRASTTYGISDAYALSLTSVQPTSLAHHSYTQSSITATHCTMVFQKPS